jgi:tetratricopeptide (TPR) repeat protein
MKGKFILLPAIALLFAACSQEFLETEPTGYLSTEQLGEIAKQNPTLALEPLVTGLYSSTFAAYTGGSTGHDDFGQKSIDICMDYMSGDFGSAATAYNWFMSDYNYTSQIRTANRTYMTWRYYYRLIKSANEVFDILGGDATMPESDDAKAYYGQAKAMRAYCYFYLVNLYQHPYSDKKDSPGVPVYRSQLTTEIHGQSSVREIYDLIISDLEDAVKALDKFDRGSDKSKVDKYVAAGLLANAYLMRGEGDDYVKAAAAANTVISSGKFPLMDADAVLNSGFRSVTIPSWMWAIDLTTENTGSLVTFWGHVDYFTYSYAYAGNIKIMDGDLYASIPVSDVRKKQFGSPSTGVVGANPLAPIWKFYDAGRKAGGDRTWTNDLVYMRAEEMYLLRAEALARSGNADGAKAALKSLLDLRDKSAAANLASLTAAQLLEAIYFNWRVEMWGEGKALLAVKRYKKNVARAANHVYHPNKSFNYNYEWMIFEIPENERINNPNLVPQQ